MTSHAGGPVALSLPVPFDASLCGLEAHLQGVLLSMPGAVLTNALDLRIGP